MRSQGHVMGMLRVFDDVIFSLPMQKCVLDAGFVTFGVEDQRT